MQLSGYLCLTCCNTLVWLQCTPTVKMVKLRYVIFCLLIFFLFTTAIIKSFTFSI